MDETDDEQTVAHFRLQQSDWRLDRAGVYHWKNREPLPLGSTMRLAARKCLESRVRMADGPAWFWWNETPAPIAGDDTELTLIERWSAWRAAYHAGGTALLDKLLTWSTGSVLVR